MLNNNMDIGAFSQLGIGIATLVILWFVVRYFIDALTRKDEYIKEVTRDFTQTINNHMKHETDAFTSLAKAIEKLTKKIDAKPKK